MPKRDPQRQRGRSTGDLASDANRPKTSHAVWHENDPGISRGAESGVPWENAPNREPAPSRIANGLAPADKVPGLAGGRCRKVGTRNAWIALHRPVVLEQERREQLERFRRRCAVLIPLRRRQRK